jgi:hypothetical protein
LSKKAGGAAPAARPPQNRRLPYEKVRDRFVAEEPQNDREALEYLVRLGLYITSRWEAIASDDPAGAIINEDASPRWDECTQREYEKLTSEAQDLIAREVAKQRVRALFAAMLKEPWDTIAGMAGWVFMRAWEHFVGAIGLLLFGLLLVWAFPHFVKQMRSAFDETLPQQTSPYSDGGTAPQPPSDKGKPGSNR